MQAHQQQFRVVTMCRVLKVERSGYYAWLKCPQSARAKDDARLLAYIEESYLASGGVYGSRNVHRDLTEAGERIGRKRVERLMRQKGLRSVRSPLRRRYKGGKPAVVAPNRLQRQFTVKQPDLAWVTDITYLRTAEGWLYLAVVIDLYSRRVVGWSMGDRMPASLVCDALRMALFNRRMPRGVIVHTDRGSQYCSHEHRALLDEHGLIASMSAKGNCYDNAAMESWNHSLKVEAIHGERFATREQARAHVFEYIEVDYNRNRLHSTLGYLSPEQFEQANAA